jgi:hypothetical protein
MTLRWLVIYRTLNTKTAAKVVVDYEHKFPFGVYIDMIGEDCHQILAIVSLPDDYEPDTIVDGHGREVEVQLPEEDEE